MKKISIDGRHFAFAMVATTALLAGCQGLPQSRYDGKDYLVYVEPGDLMLQGHDVVSLFTESKIRDGSPQYQTHYHDATYYFASAEDKSLFEANPSKYEPAYGGHCAVAVALGHLSPATIETWKIIDGTLYVQHNQKALDLWNENEKANVALSKKNWPILLADYDKKDP